jgi:hypothetical protein
MPAPTTIAKIPQNQLNALPLTDAATAAAGGDIVVLGSAITRYWSPTVLGVSGARRTGPEAVSGYFALVTPYLDVRGCSQFVVLLQRNGGTGVGAIGTSATCSFQYRFATTDTQPFGQNGGVGDNAIGKSNVGGGAIPFPSVAAQPLPQYNVRAFSLAVVTGSAGVSNMIGTDVRIIIDWSTTDPEVGAGGTVFFSIAMWGASQ